MQRSALCRSRRELSNEYLLAKFGFGPAENEPSKVGRDPVSPDCNRDCVRGERKHALLPLVPETVELVNTCKYMVSY